MYSQEREKLSSATSVIEPPSSELTTSPALSPIPSNCALCSSQSSSPFPLSGPRNKIILNLIMTLPPYQPSTPLWVFPQLSLSFFPECLLLCAIQQGFPLHSLWLPPLVSAAAAYSSLPQVMPTDTSTVTSEKECWPLLGCPFWILLSTTENWLWLVSRLLYKPRDHLLPFRSYSCS